MLEWHTCTVFRTRTRPYHSQGSDQCQVLTEMNVRVTEERQNLYRSYCPRLQFQWNSTTIVTQLAKVRLPKRTRNELNKNNHRCHNIRTYWSQVLEENSRVKYFLRLSHTLWGRNWSLKHRFGSLEVRQDWSNDWLIIGV